MKGAKQGATFFLCCDYEDLEKSIPAALKKQIAEKDIKFYTVNAMKMAASVGLGNRISLITVMFLMALGMEGLIEIQKAAASMKALAKITYAKQAQKVIDANMKAVDMTLEVLNSCKYEYNK